ncbi:MAG: hypothetical protein LWX09_00405 [Bacteroidia bacterium]|jgi:hypothetical protein|nr:hypothetical protein [Bacteroidia bacterium]
MEIKVLDFSQFSPHLFWDVNRIALSPEKDKAYIIKQILEFGKIEDWFLLRNFYGIEEIANVAQSFRDLDPKALSFIALLSQRPKHAFRCFTFQQSIPKHWNF